MFVFIQMGFAEEAWQGVHLRGSEHVSSTKELEVNTAPPEALLLIGPSRAVASANVGLQTRVKPRQARVQAKAAMQQMMAKADAKPSGRALLVWRQGACTRRYEPRGAWSELPRPG
jgi:hypothetical protein